MSKFGAAVVLLLAIALAAPAWAQETKERPQSARDAEIQKQVEKEIREEHEYKDVSATVDDAVVTLTGYVDTYRRKKKVEEEAREEEGVSAVRNLVRVRGDRVADTELQQHLADRLRYDRIDRGIMFNNLSLQVKDGVVTVGGNVRDEADRASALAIVENTRGVMDVKDEIKVAPASINDDRIRIAVARAIYQDPALQRYGADPQAPIRIVVENGRVTLYGVVANRMDKQIAETRAREVPGSFAVENRIIVANEREVEPARADTDEQKR
jgi:osmotically-inducible protein OsmY